MNHLDLLDCLRKKDSANSITVKYKENCLNLSDLFLTSSSLMKELYKENYVSLTNDYSLYFLYKLLFALVNKKPFLLNGLSNNNAVETIKNVIGVLETTGSTGEAKLIGIEENTLLANIESFFSKINNASSVGLFVSWHYSYGFNCLIGSLMFSSFLNIASQDRLNDIDYFIEFLNESDNKVIFCPAALLNYISSNKLFLRVKRKDFSIYFAGELSTLSNEFFSFCNDSKIKLFDVYGLTETGVLFCDEVYEKTNQNQFKNSDIIKPYILDENSDSSSELKISLMDGFCGFYDITNRRNVFQSDDEKGIFSTKDIIKHIDFNRFQIIGRNDDIIKINGLKTSTHYIENIIVNIDGVKDCLVCYLTNSNDRNILAALVVASKEITIDQIVSELEKKIPQNEVPIIKFVSKIPLNKNGKKHINNLSALCDMYFFDSKTIFNIIRRVVENQLDSEEIIINSSLKQLGINSIDLVSLVSLLEKEYQIDFDYILLNSNHISLKQIIEYIKDNKNV